MPRHYTSIEAFSLFPQYLNVGVMHRFSVCKIETTNFDYSLVNKHRVEVEDTLPPSTQFTHRFTFKCKYQYMNSKQYLQHSRPLACAKCHSETHTLQASNRQKIWRLNFILNDLQDKHHVKYRQHCTWVNVCNILEKLSS